MKPFNNWNNIQAAGEYKKLPMGGYVCNILKAELKTTRTGSEMLAVNFDIAKGDYKNFYAEDYRSQNREDKYWKGVIRLFLPVEDGSDKDAYTKSRFKAFTNAVEDSNPGYHWDWNEDGLKGKSIGMVTRHEEWEKDGRSGMVVRPFKFVNTETIENGNFTLPADKYINGSAPQSNSSNTAGFSIIDDGDDDIPF
jgi:hypothetical protein